MPARGVDAVRSLFRRIQAAPPHGVRRATRAKKWGP